jgi:hypothetical protein
MKVRIKMSDIPNLKEIAKELGYRSYTSEDYFTETSSTTNQCRDPWYFEMRGAKATIMPWGVGLLAVCTKGRSNKAKNLLKESWVDLERSQIGDDGCNVVFPVENLKDVLKEFKFYKKTVLSEERRKALVESAKNMRKKVSE